MIAGLDTLLETTGQPGLAELRAMLRELLGGARVKGRVTGERRLDHSGSVNRVHFEVAGRRLSLVAKRSRPAPAQRNSFAVKRWLPAVGLESFAPRILGTAAERAGACVWHVWEDLGERTLETDPEPGATEAATSLLGDMHARFIGHPMLAEVREWGGDLGRGFYTSSVRDAITCLEAISPGDLDGCDGELELRDRLLERMWVLREEEGRRTEAILELGGPDTLLHGDLWLKNAAVVGHGEDLRVRLIDWDHVGLGPVGYDLSTFLNGFPNGERDHVLGLYEDVAAAGGLRLAPREDLNYLFATFELARIANCVVWSAFAVTEGPHVRWALEELQMADDWLASLATTPVLP